MPLCHVLLLPSHPVMLLPLPYHSCRYHSCRCYCRGGGGGGSVRGGGGGGECLGADATCCWLPPQHIPQVAVSAHDLLLAWPLPPPGGCVGLWQRALCDGHGGDPTGRHEEGAHADGAVQHGGQPAQKKRKVGKYSSTVDTCGTSLVRVIIIIIKRRSGINPIPPMVKDRD